MKVKIFDVVELNDQNKATILSINTNEYLVEIVDKNGISQGTSYIKESDIKEVIFTKKL